ncbi:hypothetical protein K2X30_09720 [bacterium]|jgi:hypothetical protein|nr:hypothetical protein [bacterium]
MYKISSFVVVAFAISIHAWGAELDAASSKALEQTQKLLTNRAQRGEVIKDSPSARSVDQQVHTLTGNPQTADEVYQLSAAILEDLVKETGGDPVKMQAIVNGAQTNPNAFEHHISDQNRSALKTLERKISNDPTSAPRTNVAPQH